MKLSSLVWLFPLTLLGLVVYVVIAATRTEPHGQETVPTVQASSGAVFPRSFRDDNGREVVIKTRPQRIIPSDCGPADMLAELVDSRQIAALPAPVDTYGGVTEFYKQHADIPRFQVFNAETVLSFKPDLVIFTTYRDPEIARNLESHGVTVIRFENYRTFDGIRGTLEALGRALGEDARTNASIDAFDRRLKDLQVAISGQRRPRVISYSNFGNGFAVGVGESEDEVIRRAGAINIAAELKLSGHVNFSFEQMLKANPDWIITFGDQGLESQQAQFLLHEPALARLDAIKQKHIAVIPDRYYSSISQYILNAVEILARQIHAGAFPPAPPATINPTPGAKDATFTPPNPTTPPSPPASERAK